MQAQDNQQKFYNYQIFDPESKPVLFGGLNVFELDPETFQLRRRIHATRAQWSAGAKYFGC